MKMKLIKRLSHNKFINEIKSQNVENIAKKSLIVETSEIKDLCGINEINSKSIKEKDS